jgi:spherulation-specific family 4 protein
VKAAAGWYGSGIGFMFDQAGTSCGLESRYYGPLYDYAKSVTNDGTVELSPGTVTAGMACYMNAADILQVFEGSENGSNVRLGPAGFQGHRFPQWMRAYPASRFAATISQASASGAGIDVADAAADRIGNIYIDDEPEPDPGYQTLPAFWSAEVADVAGVPPAGLAAQRIIVPLYATADSPAWAQVTGAAPAVRASVVDICAPDGTGSGCAGGKPADAPNPAWPPVIGALRGAGVLPLYYIATGYGSTPLAVVEAEVTDAVLWYGTPSVMLDQVPTACSDVPYYQALYGFVHALGRHRHAGPGDCDGGVVVLPAGQRHPRRVRRPAVPLPGQEVPVLAGPLSFQPVRRGDQRGHLARCGHRRRGCRQGRDRQRVRRRRGRATGLCHPARLLARRDRRRHPGNRAARLRPGSASRQAAQVRPEAEPVGRRVAAVVAGNQPGA